MRTLNLEALGITEESLTNAVLNELGLTKEEAVKELAAKFGVDLGTNEAPVETGATILTSAGEATAQVLTPAEIETLRNAAEIQSRIFG